MHTRGTLARPPRRERYFCPISSRQLSAQRLAAALPGSLCSTLSASTRAPLKLWASKRSVISRSRSTEELGEGSIASGVTRSPSFSGGGERPRRSPAEVGGLLLGSGDDAGAGDD